MDTGNCVYRDWDLYICIEELVLSREKVCSVLLLISFPLISQIVAEAWFFLIQWRKFSIWDEVIYTEPVLTLESFSKAVLDFFNLLLLPS